MEMTTDEKLGNTGGQALPTESKRQRGRSVKITFKDWRTDGKETTEKATFHCWGVRTAKSTTTQGAFANHMETVGICELDDGHIRQVRPERIQFTDQQSKKESKQ